MPISQITNITPKGSFPSEYGTNGVMYAFNVEFEDGMVGDANSKSPTPPYKVGDTREWTQTGVHKGVPKLKIQKPDPSLSQGPSQAAQEQRVRENASFPPAASQPQIHGQTVGMAINNALELIKAKGIEYDADEFWKDAWIVASRIIKLSQTLEQGKLWQKPGAAPAPVAPPPPKPAPAREVPDDDVPF